MKRRIILLFVFVTLVGAGLPVPFSLRPPAVTQAKEKVDLKEQLESGLKARRPEEFAFIALVVSKVESKQLPIDMVQSTFIWARGQQPRPYQFFERGLRVRAARLGITL